MNYAHVEDRLIRSVLEGDISEDALCYAIAETIRHAQADQDDENVHFLVSERRFAFAQDAADWWNKEGNALESLKCLRQCWRY